MKITIERYFLWLFLQKQIIIIVTNQYELNIGEIYKNNYHNSPLERGWGCVKSKTELFL